jgi:hypothetical protein
MSSWNVEIRSGSGEVATVDLVDKFGPLNDWADKTPGAFDPASGTFTNQLKVVVPSVQPSWLLKGFDIDEVSVGDTGDAEVLDSGTNFPNGNMKWTVLAKL